MIRGKDWEIHERTPTPRNPMLGGGISVLISRDVSDGNKILRLNI